MSASESLAQLMGAWSSFCANYNEITFAADGTYSWRSLVMANPRGSGGDPQKRFVTLQGESEPLSSYQPPEHYPAFGTWRVMTDEEWTAWLKRTRQVKAFKSPPRLCIHVAPCHIRVRQFDVDGRIMRQSFPPKGVEIFLLSRQGIELYCAEGGTTSLFRKGALPDPLPKLPPADSYKAQDAI